MKQFALFILVNAAWNKSSFFHIDQVANLIFFSNMQLDLLYLKYFLIYSWLKSPTHMRKFLETVINIIVGQICEKIVHFMIKA